MCWSKAHKVPQQVPRVIAQDADNDQVLACAVQAHLIASGDQHLHSLGGNYLGVRIVKRPTAWHFATSSSLTLCRDRHSAKRKPSPLEPINAPTPLSA